MNEYLEEFEFSLAEKKLNKTEQKFNPTQNIQYQIF
jgi:hypothetical protein